jgi:Rrf2 family protein
MIPKPFLRGILQELEKKKIVKSFKGKGGGFDLTKASEEIFLTELIAIFQGPIKLHECLIRKSICPNVRECLLKEKIEKIRKYTIAELESITINSIIHQEVKDERSS